MAPSRHVDTTRVTALSKDVLHSAVISLCMLAYRPLPEVPHNGPSVLVLACKEAWCGDEEGGPVI